MKKMKSKLNIIKGLGMLVLVVAMNTSFAQQDPMYTQYMFNTQTINPAYAGTWESIGFMALARQQWVGFEGAPQTYTFSFQAPLRNERVALGLNAISDKVGLEKRFSLFGDYSYMVRITERTNLRLGLKGGFTNYSNNLQAYQLYPDGLSDPLFQGEIDTKFMPNFGVGAFLYNKNYYVGFSIPKLIHNDFKNNFNNYSVQAEMRHYFLIAGVVFDLNEWLAFKPTFLTKATVGAPIEFDFSANFLLTERLWLGAMYRTGDAFGFIAQWVFDKKLRVGYAVDFTTTKLQNHHSGTHEIMVSYELKFLSEKFVSPRYF
jgi:type IX secretion system PorP/SprF family membrane protein